MDRTEGADTPTSPPRERIATAIEFLIWSLLGIIGALGLAIGAAELVSWLVPL